MDNWDALRTAYVMGRLGTVSAAAEELGVHRATVSRHIDAVEAELGVKLFLRHRRGYTPTEAGRDFLRTAGKAAGLFADFAGRTRGRKKRLSGDIIVTTVPPLAALMTPAVALFRERHPGVSVTFNASSAFAKLEYGEAHVALRTGAEPKESDYVAQSYGQLDFGLYAHRSYTARNGAPATLEEFGAHDFCVPEPDPRAPFMAWMLANIPAARRAITSNHPLITFEAVLSGLAIGFIPTRIAARHPNLVEVMAPRAEWSRPLWLVTHVDLHRSEKVQAMLRALKETRNQDVSLV